MALPYQVTFKLLFWRLYKFAQNLIPSKTLRKKLKKITPRKWEVVTYSAKNMQIYQDTLSLYPDILPPSQTLELVMPERSFSRIGDGEFNIMIGINNSFNKSDARLAQRLIEICETGSTSHCVVCLNNYKLPKNHPAYDWFLYDGMRHLQEVLQLTKFNAQDYGDAYFLIRCTQKQGVVLKQGLEKIKTIWAGHKVLFVCNDKSAVIQDQLNFFDEVTQKEFLFIPSRNAFSSYDKILANIKQYGTDWKIYMEAGATASVLAWDLAPLGYHALDMGDFYNRCIEILLNNETAKFIC